MCDRDLVDVTLYYFQKNCKKLVTGHGHGHTCDPSRILNPEVAIVFYRQVQPEHRQREQSCETPRNVLYHLLSDNFGKFCFKKSSLWHGVFWKRHIHVYKYVCWAIRHEKTAIMHFPRSAQILAFVKLMSFLPFAQRMRQGDGTLKSTAERCLMIFFSFFTLFILLKISKLLLSKIKNSQDP